MGKNRDYSGNCGSDQAEKFFEKRVRVLEDDKIKKDAVEAERVRAKAERHLYWLNFRSWIGCIGTVAGIVFGIYNVIK